MSYTSRVSSPVVGRWVMDWEQSSLGAVKMAQQCQVDTLRLILGTHVVGGEN